ncbi:hypothetical protein [Aquimarina algiphila]|uniref:hypothetical protein n=1 Tax=Aquimarina algiphila TaxID=2047982 RepID=UPI00142F902D|nr:hypothetical protein [Aquimarina algiphila]
MKTITYLLIALFITANLTSCTADSVANDEDISAELVATNGENGQVDSEDAGGGQ